MNAYRSNSWLFVLVLLLLGSSLACDLISGGDDDPNQPAGADTEEIAATPTATPEEPTSEPVSEPASTPTPTATPTAAPLPSEEEELAPDACAGVSGEIELRILVGPAEVVGLEPEAVGSIPFEVVTNEAPFLVEGGGNIDFYDVLAEEWGTYEVTFNAQISISGECVSNDESEVLNLVLEMTGSQLVEVTAEGFHGVYPWEGTNSFEYSFPLAEGATYEGEGWVFVLHVNAR